MKKYKKLTENQLKFIMNDDNSERQLKKKIMLSLTLGDKSKKIKCDYV